MEICLPNFKFGFKHFTAPLRGLNSLFWSHCVGESFEMQQGLDLSCGNV